jgi:hypothetical protein
LPGSYASQTIVKEQVEKKPILFFAELLLCAASTDERLLR